MKVKIPFYYRNKPLGKLVVEIPKKTKCPRCGKIAEISKARPIVNIGPRYYARYSCLTRECLVKAQLKVRVNELTELEIKKLKRK